ncbi:hypothetical protein [Psychrobacter sp. I-STPA10]|uniref:hypothetical protein n=1 Tax=Psychrobacter sp. I-STPA10 TaxID=2585769 RepID=UPI001E313897|nr:hypothetical protein [Psychrobacter sp. I-STPA10]
MKRQQKTKVEPAATRQYSANVATPKRLVSSLRQVLCQTINIPRQSFAQAMFYGTLGILPLSLLSLAAQASELDIYEQSSPTIQGKGPIITMMLDTSGSMGGPLTFQSGASLLPPHHTEDSQIAANKQGTNIVPPARPVNKIKMNTWDQLGLNSITRDYPSSNCDLPNALDVNGGTFTGLSAASGYIQLFDFTAKIDGKSDIKFQIEGCKVGSNYYYTRLGRLQLAMISLLADKIESTDNIEVKVLEAIKNGGFQVAMGHYPSYNSNGSIGNILVPAGPVNDTVAGKNHRSLLITEIAKLRTSGLTPIAHSYAEAGAYMLGTKTTDIIKEERYQILGIRRYPADRPYLKCVNNVNDISSITNTNTGKTYKIYGCQGWEAVNNEADLSSIPGAIKLTDVNYDTKWSGASQGTYATENTKDIWVRRGDEWPESPYSGFAYSSADTKDSAFDNTRYKSPIPSGPQCGANGIYYLTDGIPDNAYSKKGVPEPTFGKSPISLMNTSLMNDSSIKVSNSCGGGFTDNIITKGGSTTKSIEFNGWTCIGAYAKALNNSTLSKGKILTALVGFGTDFKGANSTNCAIKKDENGNPIELSGKCKAFHWGNEGSGYGEGGFTAVETSEQIADSFVAFANKLKGQYNPQAGEGPSIAIDPTNSTDNRSFAYLPMMLPRPGSSNLLWSGNLKKYNIKNGTLFDAKDKPLYSGLNGQVNTNSFGLWNKTATADGGNIRSGGMYAKLVGPDATNLSSLRTVYVEKSTNGNIAKIAVNVTSPTGIQDLGYNLQRQHYLLNFLGYDKVPVFSPDRTVAISGNNVSAPIAASDYASGGGYDGVVKPMDNITDYAPSSSVKILGGTNNSKPQEILYQYTSTPSSTAGAAPIVTDSYKILYGSMDGALHLVDASTGQENWAFIPNVVMKDDHQIAALKEGSVHSASGEPNNVGNVAFGVDAPWYITTAYTRSYDNTSGKTTVTPSAIKAYGGLGRGGEGLYGLNITNTSSPSILFHIDSHTSGFSDLGRTWSKPVAAKVQVKESDGKMKPKEVLFVSGGYDKCYDIPSFMLDSTDAALIKEIKDKGLGAQCLDSTQGKTKAKAKGSAVYMLDPDNGDLLWTATNTNMKHSVVGEVSVVYADDDDYADIIYFADLGGQVFRIDLDGTKGYNEKTSGGSESLWAKRVVRILDTSEAGKPALRFFQRPVPSSYNVDANNNSVGRGGQLFEVVTVVSGDRNNPLSKLSDRQATETPNKVIAIWDVDVTKDNILTIADTDLTLRNSNKEGVTLSQLEKMDWSDSKTGLTNDQKNNIRTGSKYGWYDDLTYFSGASSAGTSIIKSVTSPTDNKDAIGDNINYLKVISQPTLRAGRLYVPVYNRMAYIPSSNACSPVPTGVTEAHEYCLPFGVCSSTTKNAAGESVVQYKRGQTYILGSGISAINIASGEGTNRAHLITPEQVQSSTGGATGVLAAVKDAFYSLYNLIPNEWFERRPIEESSSSSSSSGSGTSGGSSSGGS